MEKGNPFSFLPTSSLPFPFSWHLLRTLQYYLSKPYQIKVQFLHGEITLKQQSPRAKVGTLLEGTWLVVLHDNYYRWPSLLVGPRKNMAAIMAALCARKWDGVFQPFRGEYILCKFCKKMLSIHHAVALKQRNRDGKQVMLLNGVPHRGISQRVSTVHFVWTRADSGVRVRRFIMSKNRDFIRKFLNCKPLIFTFFKQ